MMSYLVTGSEGFLGSHLVEQYPYNRGVLYAPTVAELDLTDYKMVKDYLKDKQITHCIHCATVLRSNAQYPVDVCESNLKMFFNLIRYLPQNAKMLSLGSGSEYSRKHWQMNMKESFFDTYVPEDPHSFSKYVISKYIGHSIQSNMASLRIFGIFGEREDYLYKFVSNTVVKSIHKLPIVVNQNCLFNYLDVQDFCRIVYKLVDDERLYKMKTINVGHPVNLHLETIVQQVISIFGEETGLSYQIVDGELGNPYTPDLTNMMMLLGEDFTFLTLDESISRLKRYYCSIQSKLDIGAIIQDKYLDYAKSIMKI